MLATKSVSLSFILKKLSILTCFFLLAGLGESYFLASANAQQVSEENLIKVKSGLSFSKKATNVIDAKTETVIASESVEPATSVHDPDSEEINNSEEVDDLKAESSASKTQESPQESVQPTNDLAKQIIAELNRVRTNPQGYADWLESQKQYYQGMIVTLPGEQSLRTNRGLRTLNEAIAFVRSQQPVPALSDSEDLLTNAQEQVTAIINQQKIDHHTNNLVYNRLTPKAIVMQLVVDDGFPDRRHRLAVFQEDYQHTGIVCQKVEIYQQICAIAYENKPLEILQDSPVQVATNKPSTSNTSSTSQASQSETPDSNSVTNTSPNDSLPVHPSSANPEVVDNNIPSPPPGSAPEKVVETKSAAIANSPSTSLPAPPSAPSEVVTPPASDQNQPAAESGEVDESAIATNSAPPEAAKPEQNSAAATTPDNSSSEDEQVTAAVEKTSENTATPTQQQPQKTAAESKVPETKSENTEVAAANTVKPAQVAEIIESGVLEEGDEVVPNDGSFYDSFPLEGSAGDSFSISLESQDFDTFLAVMDPEGNIIEKNDDLNEQTSNSRLEITLPESGSYSVIVNAYDQGGKGKYTLKVTE